MTVILSCDNTPCRYNKDAQCTFGETVHIDASGSCVSAAYVNGRKDVAPPRPGAPQDRARQPKSRNTDWFKSI